MTTTIPAGVDAGEIMRAVAAESDAFRAGGYRQISSACESIRVIDGQISHPDSVRSVVDAVIRAASQHTH